MQMRLLNLVRSTDRLALFRARNPHAADVMRMDAIDGTATDRKALIAHDVMSPTLRYTDGALGNALSHLRIWRDAVRSGEAFTVIEDDAVLCANFQSEVERTIGSLPDDWDYVMWGYNFDAPVTYHLGPCLSQGTSVFSQDTLRSAMAGFPTQFVTTHLMKLMRGFGTVAYSISPRGAERLINFCLPLRPLTTVHPGLVELIENRRIDNMLAHAWPSLSAYVALPPLAVSENDAQASTVLNRTNRLIRSAGDAFPLVAFAPIARILGNRNGIAIGLRAAHEAPLAISGLRGAGWGGFDISVDAAKLGKALRERQVEPGFDLLYVGPGCPTQDMLSAALEPFQPRAVIVPPERSVPAWAVRWETAPSNGVVGERPAYAAFAEARGYTLRRCPEAPGHVVLFHPDVAGQEVIEPFGDATTVGPDHPISYSVDRKEVVRLWQ